MGYENGFSIKVIKYPTRTLVAMACPTCNKQYDMLQKFCSSDGETLESKETNSEIKDIISIFRKNTEDAYLIDDNGDSECTGNGRYIDEDLVKFSKNHSDAVFQLNVRPDSGFGTGPERYYIKNGKKQTCEVTTTFEEYDESKLE